MRKWIKYVLLIVVVVVITIGSYIIVRTSYEGNDKIIFINPGKAYTSFKDLIQLPAFKNKIIYVDVWGTNCPSCFEEFKNYTPALTERFKYTKDIAFLYICIDRHPLPAIRWKDKIQLFKPIGYHVLVAGDAEYKLAMDIFGAAADGQFFPYQPCYFIVNRQGQIVNKPPFNPVQGEFKPSDRILLYNRLDSLRKL